MKYFMLFAQLLLLACSSYPQKNKGVDQSFEKFKMIKLNEKADLAIHFYTHSTKDKMTIGGQSFTHLEYEGDSKVIFAEFLENEKNQIVEKAFLPTAELPEHNLEYVLNTHFKNISFDKLPVKCSHYSEIILVNKKEGFFIVTKDVKDAKVDVIGYALPEVLNLRITENNRKCRYSK